MGTTGIALYGHDPLSLYGTAALLELEKIPFRTVQALEDVTNDELVVAAGCDLERIELARLTRMRSLVLGGGVHFASLAFGRKATAVEEPVVVTLDAALWPRSMARRFGELGQPLLALPATPFCRIEQGGGGQPAGMLLGNDFCQPAVLRDSLCVWSALDAGGAYARLMTEAYYPEAEAQWLEWLRSSALERGIQSIYYAAPAWVRRRIQSACYARAQHRLGSNGWPASEYPADASGMLLGELLKGLLLVAGGSLVRLSRWPAPYRSAALMTHDIEPSRYAYSRGIERLLDEQRSGDRPVFGLVAQWAARQLQPRTIARLSGYDVLCHGLTHRAEPLRGDALDSQLRLAKSTLEQRLGRRILGYRSPRLDRSSDLARALDAAGFEYDSSYPDSDRENIARFGAGVRINVPYRPPIARANGEYRPSRCLELPLAAPDCIQPLFAGESIDQLKQAVIRKAEMIRAGAGLQVALVHGGVFGDQDAALREQHRRFVAEQLSSSGTWRPRASELLDWWCTREQLELQWDGWSLRVANPSRLAIQRVHAIFEDAEGERSAPLPRLEPGGAVSIALRYVAAHSAQRNTVLHP
ncbi:MAG TPA: hypothetical protein VEB21_21165 [Terriglobales bacterium]|nr:hypothetical protein [Terriglobales bacterium]